MVKTILHTVGLFGTCGNSVWRKPFIEAFEPEGIQYFNPQVPDWNPAFAKEEAMHMAHDGVICFPVLAETYGCGSLAETGFSIAQAMRFDDRRDFIILIDEKPDDVLNIDNPDKGYSKVAFKESCRARALVSAHLKECVGLRNVFFVKTLEEMLNVTKVCYKSMLVRNEVQQFSLAELSKQQVLVG